MVLVIEVPAVYFVVYMQWAFRCWIALLLPIK